METNETRKGKYNKIILKEKIFPKMKLGDFTVAEGHRHPLVRNNDDICFVLHVLDFFLFPL